jgi:hypothetical protein
VRNETSDTSRSGFLLIMTSPILVLKMDGKLRSARGSQARSRDHRCPTASRLITNRQFFRRPHFVPFGRRDGALLISGAVALPASPRRLRTCIAGVPTGIAD